MQPADTLHMKYTINNHIILEFMRIPTMHCLSLLPSSPGQSMITVLIISFIIYIKEAVGASLARKMHAHNTEVVKL